MLGVEFFCLDKGFCTFFSASGALREFSDEQERADQLSGIVGTARKLHHAFCGLSDGLDMASSDGDMGKEQVGFAFCFCKRRFDGAILRGVEHLFGGADRSVREAAARDTDLDMREKVGTKAHVCELRFG